MLCLLEGSRFFHRIPEHQPYYYKYLSRFTLPRLQKALANAICIYLNKGFCVVTAIIDNQFIQLHGLLGSTDLNGTAAAEHTKEV